MAQQFDFITQTLKSLDPERYLCCLYLPENIRHLAMTLYAFDAEIAKIPDLVSEPIPGEIRIQWWRDLVRSGGNAGSGPLADALVGVMKQHNLPPDVLDNLLEARIFDLYNDPMPDETTYDGYLGETQSALLNLISGASKLERNRDLADACGHSGVAIGMARHLASCLRSRKSQQIFFPIQMITNQGLSREEWFDGAGQQHVMVIRNLLEKAERHVKSAKAAITNLPADRKSIFIPLVLAESLLKQIGQNPSTALESVVSLSPLKRQWVAFCALSRL